MSLVEQAAAKRVEKAARRRERRETSRRRVGVAISVREDGERREVERETVTTNAEADARMLAARIAPTFESAVAFYAECGMDKETARKHATDDEESQAEAARKCPPKEQSWGRLGALARADFGEAVAVWLRVMDFAFDELETGIRSAEVTGNTSPLERARFLAVRDRFIDEWQPRGGIEAALVDMLAQCFSLYLYWTFISHTRAVETQDSMRKELKRYEDGGWKVPFQSAADAIEQAHMMADRYNRMFLRTLRQMRDLRRYAPPVIVNNGGQVNVASQQVNVSREG